MIRRDYLLGMIDQCIQALANSLRWMEHGQFSEAQTEIEQTIRGLVGLELTQVLTLSETELLGALLRDEPTQLLRQKGMLLVSLLHRAGAIHAAQGNAELSHACSLRALDLQLDLLLREGQFDFPEFVPRVDALVQALKDVSLPVRTNVALMRHYESTGAFANAEDALFSLLEGHSAEKELLQFGIQFYERLAHQSDTALELGNLPRPEVEAGLAELRTRAAA